jgi:predicted nucleic acid-binding protein
MKWVIDASVAAKWFLPSKDEQLVPEALALLQAYKNAEHQFVVPDLFWAEFGNILCKAVRRSRCSKAVAETSLTELLAQDLVTVASEALLPEALKIATTFDRSMYDSLYVALAVAVRVQLITADEKLVNALGGNFPVKWLGTL